MVALILSRRRLCRRIHAVHADGYPMIDGRALSLPGKGCIGGKPIIPPGFDIWGRYAGFLPEYALIPAIRGSRYISTGCRQYCREMEQRARIRRMRRPGYSHDSSMFVTEKVYGGTLTP
ncbi:hypothetical protein Memar_0777 [Methanoculleus marisnigri JR1]|uniref:Uncharacterized protein n=1 Tax=Methanoculleus marisnigri (strain ATCC 35101 / DSM 1498 / JR1) TaxID=368407 RepID=A3CTL0_METMJ|nr:hypothetical protein Memar_0777 [Methanoculleus marisnigri JR1]